jgi:3-methyladenine DNA glycosylase AlkD
LFIENTNVILKSMNQHHKDLLDAIKKHAQKKNPTKLPDTYSGSSHKSYFLATNQLRTLAKEWVKIHKDITTVEFIEFLTSLFHGESYEEKSVGGKILEYSKHLRKRIKPTDIDDWIEHLQGWAEIDSLCQSSFTADNILENWQEWEKQILLFARSNNISKNRASLVLLTGTVNKSDDKRLSDLAFTTINILQKEKDILITKAISWLLRDLITYNKAKVETFLDNHKNTLPKIALRETKRKLLTGRK